MYARIKVLPGGTMPEYKSKNAAGFDLAAAEDALIGPGEVVLVGTGLIIEPPDGCWTALIARSSLHKRGLKLANAVGVVDPDYCGPSDEIKLAIENFSNVFVNVKAGERLAQAVFMPLQQVALVQAATLRAEVSRGGFGSTGIK